MNDKTDSENHCDKWWLEIEKLNHQIESIAARVKAVKQERKLTENSD